MNDSFKKYKKGEEVYIKGIVSEDQTGKLIRVVTENNVIWCLNEEVILRSEAKDVK